MIKRLVLDVLKPHSPTIMELANSLSALKGISAVNIVTREMDQQTESIVATIEGNEIDFNEVRKTLNSVGAVIHSIDEVAAGKKLIEPAKGHPEKPPAPPP
ncbi:MAG: DUF211 domain-containing protein [Euryarchaeota archaeon]|nr:DUF211 domain-containing protein [Euryarchaeota archaeon]